MGQVVIIAALAGFASALLSGMLFPGSLSFAFLFFVAPLPLFLVGFGWHPLAAALAGLIGAIFVDFAIGDRGAIAFASVMLVPAYAMTAAALRAFSDPDREFRRDGIIIGQIALSALFYVGLAIVATAIWFEPNYATFMARLKTVVTEGVKMMGTQGGPNLQDPALLARFVDLMTAIMLPMSGMLFFMALVLSGALGSIIAARGRLLAYPKPPFPLFRLPGGSLLLFTASLLVAMWDGYVGVFAEIIALGIALLLMLQGLSFLHFRLRDHAAKTPLLSAAWASILFFGLPALLFIGAGIADHLLDLRNRKSAGG